MEFAPLFTYFFLAGSVVGGIVLVTAREPVKGAVGLLCSMACLAAIYALLDAHLMAALQILIYAGAIVVLIVYVIMLLDASSLGEREFRTRDLRRAVFAVMVLVAVLGPTLLALDPGPRPEVSEEFGTVAGVAEHLLGNYVLSFEISGALLLAGILGAVFLTTKEGRER